MTADFDPYHKWLGIPPAEQPPNHYRLLGITEFETDPQVIDAAADRQLTFLRKQQLGSQHREANDLLNEVARARRVLLKLDSRIQYDASLRRATQSKRSTKPERSTQPERSNRTRVRPRLSIASPAIAWGGIGLACLMALAGVISWAMRNPLPPSHVEATAQSAETSAELVRSNSKDVSQPQTKRSVPAEYHLPTHVSVLPVAFVPKDQQPPTPEEKTKFLKHIKLAQARYRELLNGDTFDIAQSDLKIVSGQRPLDFYRTPPERGAPDIVSELLTHLRVNRFQCPYVFCILLMNSIDRFPEGGGRTINGGLNTGGGMMYISSGELVRNEHFQCTLQHELGHGFGLVHVDAYNYDMNTNMSLMSYNPAHHNKGFERSATPGILIPEDRRALALNKRVFARATFDSKRDMPAVYPLANRIKTIEPMKLPGQPDFYPSVKPSCESLFSQPFFMVMNEIVPSAGMIFQGGVSWHSARELPSGKTDVEITFPVPVRLSGISVHSQHFGVDHEATGVVVQTSDGPVKQQIVDKPLTKVDEYVAFQPSTARKWVLTLQAGKTRTLVIRGLRFFDGDEEVFPHQIPYRNSAGVDDVQPAKRSVQRTEDDSTDASVKAVIPDQAAQTAAMKSLKEQFQNEYAQAEQPEGKIALATALIEKATKTKVAIDVRYVMLSEALVLASQAADEILAQQVIDELKQRFNVHPFELKERILSTWKLTGENYDEGKWLLMQYADLAQTAAKSEDFATSVKAMLSAAASLNGSIFEQLKAFAVLEAKRYEVYRDAYVVAKLSRDKLASEPADPAANLVWGRFLCCYQENWEAGLPLLAKSEDQVWKSLADRELRNVTDVEGLMKLGDDWLNAGDQETEPVTFQARERANLAWEAALARCPDKERSKFMKQFDQRMAKLFNESLIVSTDDEGVLLDGTNSMNPGTEFTIEFWLATTSKQGTLVSKRHADADSSVQMRLSALRGSKSKLQFEYVHGRGGTGSGGPNPISDGHWHHLAITRKGEKVTFFVDGKSVNSREQTPQEPLQSSSRWNLGAGKDNPPCPGQFARVRISNVARYTNGFVPPKQYHRDISTLYLR